MQKTINDLLQQIMFAGNYTPGSATATARLSVGKNFTPNHNRVSGVAAAKRKARKRKNRLRSKR